MKKEMSCLECAFNFSGICAGSYHYGEQIEKLKLCDDWKMSIDFFSELVERGYNRYKINVYDFTKKY